MSRDILQDIIGEFDTDKFIKFFRDKNRSFVSRKEKLSQYDDKFFTNSSKLGEINFTNEGQNLIVCAIESLNSLTERSGKKAQYEKGKKILKELHFDAGIFIFYDQNGNFRFSLIYANYLGKKRDWSVFRRFTYFVSLDFTNKTFLQRIGDGCFLSLEKIKDAFSVEKVTKDFYKDIANWYFWAIQKSEFPKDAEADENGRNIAIIRLITRLIFIWFMRERGLVPNDLFQKQKINDYLRNISPEESTYYKAILQNLFFATLSTKQKERKYASEKRFNKGWNKDYGNQYVFRYHEFFKNPEDLKKYFGNIPFLNGGLFECLDDKRNGIIIDGFSRTQKNQPIVPNFLFFSDEQDIDLNTEYGTKKKKRKVRGLIDTLSFYNFTIDENDPNDAEVALDPELLGRVFENLLASFNPETSTTARKATGSYYTPREIVDYMVTESLKAYFKTHLSAIEDLDEKIDQFFSTGSEENPFNKSESKKIVELIESVRIVDPAVGSGAFPMGALNKLVFILNKVDPGNELWKQAQLSAVDAITDSCIKKDTKNRIEEFFKGKNADYGRKLYLIQKCIYGVDIQRIAVEIAKLRFFISLLVDEEIDKQKNNWGIEPLPNLDFKIMQGNSLLEEYKGVKLFDEKLIVGIDFNKEKLIESIKQKQSELQREYLGLHEKNKLTKIKQAELNEELKKLAVQFKKLNQQDSKTKEVAGLFDSQNEAKQKREVLKRLHKEFFETSEKEVKDKIKKQIEKMEWNLIEVTLKEQNKIFELKKIEKFKKSNTKPFFLWKLHFADVFEKGGFDIVIANPPYIGEKGHKELFSEVKSSGSLGKYYQGKMDLFYFFFHLSLNLGNNNSQVAFISTNYYITALGARKLREDFKNRAVVRKLVNFNELKIFKSATGQHNMVTILAKGQNNEAIAKTCITKRIGDATSEILNKIVGWQDDKTDYSAVVLQDLYDGDECYMRLAGNSIISIEPVQVILTKIKDHGITLGGMAFINQGIVSGCDYVSRKNIDKLKNKSDIELNDGIYVFNLNNPRDVNVIKNFTKEESKLLRPFFKNSDIARYYCKTKPSKLFLYSQKFESLLRSQFPNIIQHLNKFKDILEQRLVKYGEKYYWSELHRSRSENIFVGEKITVPYRSEINTFAYNNREWFCRSDSYVITQKNKEVSLKYLLSLLNSKLYYLWLYHRGKRKGEILELFQTPLSEIPIKKVSKKEQKPFIGLVDKILAITKSSDYLENPAKKEEVKKYEHQIDEMVYKLYDLTNEEVDIIEGNKK